MLPVTAASLGSSALSVASPVAFLVRESGVPVHFVGIIGLNRFIYFKVGARIGSCVRIRKVGNDLLPCFTHGIFGRQRGFVRYEGNPVSNSHMCGRKGVLL